MINYKSNGDDLSTIFKLKSTTATVTTLFTSLTTSDSMCNGVFSIKRLISSYIDPILKIRRSDGTFMSFYSDNNGNLNNGSGTTIATFLTSTGYIDTWYDQSGKGNHATQTDTGSQPIFDVTNNCIDFGYSNSSNLFLNMPSGTVPVGVLDASYSFVVKHGNARNTNNGGFIGSGTGNYNACNSFRFNSIDGYWNYWWANDFGWSGTSTVPMISSVTYNGTTKIQNGYMAGVIKATTGSRAGCTNAVAVQKIGVTTAGEYLQGQIYSLIIFSVELPSADITVLNGL